MLTDIVFLLAGLVLLIGGGELLVRGAVRIAERMGLSPMLIGLTVVGMGTSMPCLLYTSPSPRDATLSRMPSSA